MNNRELTMFKIKSWIDERIGDALGNKPIITPMAQRYIGNMLSPYEKYLDGFMLPTGEFDQGFIEILSNPFESKSPTNFKLGDYNLKIEDGNLFIPIEFLGGTFKITRDDVMQLFNDLKSIR